MSNQTFRGSSRGASVPRFLAIAAVAFGAAAIAPPGAWADEFQIAQCSDGTSPVSSFAGPINTQEINDCAAGGPSYYTASSNMVSPPGNDWGAAGFGWQLPSWTPNTVINRAAMMLSLADKTGQDPGLSYGDLAVWADGVQWGSANGIPASGGWVPGFSNQPFDRSRAGGSRNVSVLVRCYTRCTFNGPLLYLHRATLTLSEDTLPAQPAFESVGLLDGGAQRGSRPLRAAVSDADSGVHTVSVRTQGGVEVGSALGGAGCSYTRPAPCPQYRAQVDVAVDTIRLPEGPQTLEVWVTDAARNVRKVATPTITVDNLPAPQLAGEVGVANPRVDGNSQVGQTLTAFDGRWSGAGVAMARQWQVSEDGETWKSIPGATAATLRPGAEHVGKLLRVLVTASNVEGSTQAASTGRRVEAASSAGGGVIVGGPSELAALTPDNGEGGRAATGRLVASSKREKARTAYKKTVRVEGRLVDEAGTAITGADVDVFETVITRGAERRKVATITTDAKGGYVYRAQPTSSRTVELTYSRQRGSAVYQSTHAIRLQVRAGVEVKLARSWVPAQGTVRLSGRVLVSDLPKSGALIQVQARDRGKWIAAGLTRANQNGKFTWTYRLRATSGQIPFRVVLRRTGDLPAVTNASRTVRVRIG